MFMWLMFGIIFTCSNRLEGLIPLKSVFKTCSTFSYPSIFLSDLSNLRLSLFICLESLNSFVILVTTDGRLTTVCQSLGVTRVNLSYWPLSPLLLTLTDDITDKGLRLISSWLIESKRFLNGDFCADIASLHDLFAEIVMLLSLL